MEARLHGAVAVRAFFCLGMAMWVALVLTGCGDAPMPGVPERSPFTIDVPDASAGGSRVPRAPAPVAGTNSPACEALTARLRWDYEDSRRCSRDEDCNYVDGFYAVIPREATDRFVTTVGCGEPSPYLVVANGERVRAFRGTMTADRAKQAAACASAEGLEPCEARAGFESRLAPRCVAGECKATRGEGYYGIP